MKELHFTGELISLKLMENPRRSSYKRGAEGGIRATATLGVSLRSPHAQTVGSLCPGYCECPSKFLRVVVWFVVSVVTVVPYGSLIFCQIRLRRRMPLLGIRHFHM